MGFSCISIEGSDTTSDLNREIGQAQTKEEKYKTLRLGACRINNEWNTPGYVNAALCLIDGNAACLLEHPIPADYRELFEMLVDCLAQLIGHYEKDTPNHEHLKALRRLHISLQRKLA